MMMLDERCVNYVVGGFYLAWGGEGGGVKCKQWISSSRPRLVFLSCTHTTHTNSATMSLLRLMHFFPQVDGGDHHALLAV